MTSVRMLIGGKDYEVACDDGQENHLRSLGRRLDERLKELGSNDKPGDLQLMMLVALLLADELQDTTRELEALRGDIHDSSRSFEKNKQIELENAVTSTIHDIATRIEAIAQALENA